MRNDRKQCDKTTTEGTRHLSCLIPDNAAMGLSTLRKKGHYEYAFRPSYFQYYVHNIHNNYPALQVLIMWGGDKKRLESSFKMWYAMNAGVCFSITLTRNARPPTYFHSYLGQTVSQETGKGRAAGAQLLISCAHWP